MGVRSSRVRTPSSAPEKEKRKEEEEEEEDVEGRGLAATTDDDEETVHETPTTTAVVLLGDFHPRASERRPEIEVTRDATVTVRALGDGRTRARSAVRFALRVVVPGACPVSRGAQGARARPPSWQRGRGIAAAGGGFIGAAARSPQTARASSPGRDDGDLVIGTLSRAAATVKLRIPKPTSFTIERAHAGRRVATATEAAGLLVARRKRRRRARLVPQTKGTKGRATERPPAGPSFARRCEITRSR